MPFSIPAAATRIAFAAVVAASVFGAGAVMAQQPSPAQEREAMQACRADYEALCKGSSPAAAASSPAWSSTPTRCPPAASRP